MADSRSVSRSGSTDSLLSMSETKIFTDLMTPKALAASTSSSSTPSPTLARGTEIDPIAKRIDNYLTLLEHKAIDDSPETRWESSLAIAQIFLLGRDVGGQDLDMSYVWFTIALQQLAQAFKLNSQSIENAQRKFHEIQAAEVHSKQVFKKIEHLAIEELRLRDKINAEEKSAASSSTSRKVEPSKNQSKLDPIAAERLKLTQGYGQLQKFISSKTSVQQMLDDQMSGLTRIQSAQAMIEQERKKPHFRPILKILANATNIFNETRSIELAVRTDITKARLFDSYAQIKKNYLTSAMKNHKDALYRLGVVAENNDKMMDAARYYRMAAAQDHPIACLRLGRHYKELKGNVLGEGKEMALETHNAHVSQIFWLKMFVRHYNQSTFSYSPAELLEGAQSIREIPEFEGIAEILYMQVIRAEPRVAYELICFWGELKILESKLRQARNLVTKAIETDGPLKVNFSDCKSRAMELMHAVQHKVALDISAEQQERELYCTELDNFLKGGGHDHKKDSSVSKYYESLASRLTSWSNAWSVLATGTFRGTEAERNSEIAEQTTSMVFGLIPVVGSKLAAATHLFWGSYNAVKNKNIWAKIGLLFKRLKELDGGRWGTNERIIQYLVQQMSLERLKQPSELDGPPSFVGALRDKCGYQVNSKAQEEGLLDLYRLMEAFWKLPENLDEYIFGNPATKQNGLDILLQRAFPSKAPLAKPLFPQATPRAVALHIHHGRLSRQSLSFAASPVAQAATPLSEFKKLSEDNASLHEKVRMFEEKFVIQAEENAKIHEELEKLKEKDKAKDEQLATMQLMMMRLMQHTGLSLAPVAASPAVESLSLTAAVSADVALSADAPSTVASLAFSVSVSSSVLEEAASSAGAVPTAYAASSARHPFFAQNSAAVDVAPSPTAAPAAQKQMIATPLGEYGEFKRSRVQIL